MNSSEKSDKYAFRMYKKYLLETLKKYGYNNVDVYKHEIFGTPYICGIAEGYDSIEDFSNSDEYDKIYDEAENKALIKIKEYEEKHKIDTSANDKATKAFINFLDMMSM